MDSYGSTKLQDLVATPQPPVVVVGEEEDLAIVDLLANDVLPYCTDSVSHETCTGLVTLLEHCTNQRGRRPLADRALESLMTVCSRVGGENSVDSRVGSIALPIVIDKCQGILLKYLEDDRKSGKCPMPKCRHEEVVFVFNSLKKLELHSSVYELIKDEDDLASRCPAAFGPKGLVLRLLPVLTEFVDCEDASLKSALKDLLKVVNSELGFGSGWAILVLCSPKNNNVATETKYLWKNLRNFLADNTHSWLQKTIRKRWIPARSDIAQSFQSVGSAGLEDLKSWFRMGTRQLEN
eukprot:gene7198-365_t